MINTQTIPGPLEAPQKATDMSREAWRDTRYRCPVEATLDVLGGRWKGAILYELAREPQRFGALQRAFPLLAQRSLTTQLRELERDGVVHREVFAQVPPKVEYSLTPRGHELVPILRLMSAWGEGIAGTEKCQFALDSYPE